jgi:hypothetical protein
MTSDSTFYHVTEKGIEAYSRWAKVFSILLDRLMG